MIKITIEMWRHGNPIDVKTLGHIHIRNDGTGTEKRGNYTVELTKPNSNKIRSVRIKNFPRKSYDVFNLIWRCLNEVFKRKS